jgi:hypothetical protein
MAWNLFGALDGSCFALNDPSNIADFRLPLTYLLNDANAIVDGFRSDSDGYIRREYERKPTIIAGNLRACASEELGCCAVLALQGTPSPIPGSEAYLITQYLTTSQAVALAKYGDPHLDSRMLRSTVEDERPTSPTTQNRGNGRRDVADDEAPPQRPAEVPQVRERLRAGELVKGVRGMLQRVVCPESECNESIRIDWRGFQRTAAQCQHAECAAYEAPAELSLPKHLARQNPLLVGTCCRVVVKRNKAREGCPRKRETLSVRTARYIRRSLDAF